MKRVLVTGATGFVGQILCESLLKAGWEVRGTYHVRVPKGAPASSIGWRKVSSIGPNTDWRGALDGVDVVVHAAAVAHRMGPQQEVPDTVYDEVNHRGAARLATCARDAGVKRVVLISSIGAVTDRADIIVNEATPCTPVTPYGRSKLAAERAVAAALDGSSCQWCILRPPLVYGPGNPGNMARLLRLVRLPLPLPFGNINNRRSFLYVGNLVSAVQVAMVHPSAAARIFCIADAEMVSTPELIRLLAQAAGRRIYLMNTPTRLLQALAGLYGSVEKGLGRPIGFNAETLQKFAASLPVSNALFRNSCDWTPPYSLVEGLAMTAKSHE